MLISSTHIQQTPGVGCPHTSGPSSTPWLEHQTVLPALFVLIQSPLNGEALALGSPGGGVGAASLSSSGARGMRGPLSPGSGGTSSSSPLRRSAPDTGDGSPSSQPSSLMGLIIDCWLRLAPAAQQVCVSRGGGRGGGRQYLHNIECIRLQGCTRHTMSTVCWVSWADVPPPPLSACDHQVLAHWVSCLPPDIFGGRVLRPMQRHISRCAQRGLGTTRAQVLQAAQVKVTGQEGRERERWVLLSPAPAA